LNFVTGATGLLGSQLVKYLLKRGEKVCALKRSTSNLALLKDVEHEIEWIDGDVLDLGALEEGIGKAQKVYHLAGVIAFTEAEKKHMYRVNIKGTANVVNCCLDANIDKLVHVSSIAAFSNAKQGVMLDEEAEWEEDDIKSGYAEVWRGMAEGLKAVIVNPSLIVGPGWFTGTGPAAIFKKIDQGMAVYTSGSNGYVDVRDVAEVMIQLMHSDITNQRFVVSAENLTYKEFFTLIANELGCMRPMLPVTNQMGAIASFFDGLRATATNSRRIITTEMVKISNARMLFDNSKVKTALNYQFMTIDKSVKDTCTVYKQSKKEKIKFGTFN
jgi:dihydroflavonol-4-reductase